MPSSILSLDLGKTTGWALIQDGVIVESGERNHSLREGEKEGKNLLRFLDFLNDQYSKHSLTDLFFEEINFIANRAHAYSFIPYEYVARMFAIMANVEISTLTPEQWKKTLTGKSRGEAGKEKFRMCAKLHSLGWKGGVRGTDKANNECDAVGLAIAILRIRGSDPVFKTLD